MKMTHSAAWGGGFVGFALSAIFFNALLGDIIGVLFAMASLCCGIYLLVKSL